MRMLCLLCYRNAPCTDMEAAGVDVHANVPHTFGGSSGGKCTALCSWVHYCAFGATDTGRIKPAEKTACFCPDAPNIPNHYRDTYGACRAFPISHSSINLLASLHGRRRWPACHHPLPSRPAKIG